MKFDLSSVTDVAHHVLYDPAATAHLSPHDLEGDAYETILGEEIKGNILGYSIASDGSTSYRLFIDEEMPDDLSARIKSKVEDLLLRLPSGTIVASGAEYVNDKRTIDSAKPTFENRFAMATKIQVQPGNYLVDAYELKWDREKDIVPTMKRELGTRYSMISCLNSIGCLSAALIVLAMVLFGFGLITFKETVYEFWWIFPLPIMACALSIALLKHFIPADYSERIREIENRFPSNVLVLKRLPDDADLSAYKGGGFGTANQS